MTCALGFAATPVLYAKVASGWFARRRGLALSLTFACSSIGIAFWSPYAIKLINLYGWRTAYATIGVTADAIIFLAGLLLLRDPPKVIATEGAGRLGPHPGAGRAQRHFLEDTGELRTHHGRARRRVGQPAGIPAAD